ncbi:MAG: AAA family ATPase [Candidatus Sericytochromatia bacterium]|nr:AAA family ATPase [Candidatus Sericytochromatia bacterium]
MYKKVSIENFKGIKSINFEDLKQFNLILGKNNSLKTTILDAFYILSTPTNTEAILQTNGYKGLTLIFPDLFRGFFHNLDMSKNIKFVAELDEYNENRELEIKIELTNSMDINNKTIVNPLSSTKLIAKFTMKKGENLPLQIISTIGMVNFKLDAKSSSNFEGLVNNIYLNPNNLTNKIIERFDRVNFIKQTDTLIKYLRQIEPKLVSITIGNGNIIYADIGIETLMPINLLGSSFTIILSVMISIMSIPKGILLIDNIENGLSYSSMELLWSIIFKVAKDFNVQIVATSNSSESLKAFHTIATRMGKIISDIKALKIDRKDDIIKVTNAI